MLNIKVVCFIYIFGTSSKSTVFLEVIKKGKEELIIIFFYQQGKLSDSAYPPPPPPSRPSGRHLNITFYLNRRMKFLSVLSLMLCYSSAQNTNDPSEYNYCTVEPP